MPVIEKAAPAPWWPRRSGPTGCWIAGARRSICTLRRPISPGRSSSKEGCRPIGLRSNPISSIPIRAWAAAQAVMRPSWAALSVEKGIQTLLDASAQLGAPLPLKIAGDGPLREIVVAAARKDPRIQWLGQLALKEILALVGDATLLAMPSVYYETFGHGDHRSLCPQRTGRCFANGGYVRTCRRWPHRLAVHTRRSGRPWPRKSGSCSPTPRGWPPCRRPHAKSLCRNTPPSPITGCSMAIYERAAALHGTRQIRGNRAATRPVINCVE